jgi:hypothetical protein
MRRIALVTTGLVAVSVAGTAVLAAVAYADTRSDRDSTTRVSPTGSATSNSTESGESDGDRGNNANSNSGPTVTTTTDPGQVTTGGS